MLWDNTQQTQLGYNSYRTLLETLSRKIIADDFVILPGEVWNIQEIYFGGFHNPQGLEYDAPDYYGIEIFEDNGNDRP